ncbi:SDR family NAD(P)-dependent oxidoreductase [Pseudonocardia broussonetiae]|uniref:SDR family NAD(P)-dependent oxidoreductase n=1 Tax=Pseudonocardia broussonetiae TaxID=2736640 RepID=A0A6M6JJ31_9PSEU|nr:SDR family NAD(P)-dependent oxidoreductase [Pseudonocardia broussonetiae]QJY48058.1 SDR family NAD(P)-dependent oxidoreductase [Pseudonocardia broussonetiae]
MDTFTGKLAVITGGGAGMGSDLARMLAAEGCGVALCDVSEANLEETLERCRTDAAPGTRVTSCVADVSSEADLRAFRAHVEQAHETDHVDLLFNNAGIGGGGYSFVSEPREQWERVFDVNWRGVYLGVRVFLPLLMRSERARIVNTSSVNGFWAGLSPTESLVAYSTAKFAVRGFSEALISDLRLRAPHVGVSVVMPGYVGTSLVRNSMTYLGDAGDGTGAIDRSFRANAPTTSESAAGEILDGVRAGEWRILVGDDARILDEAVRADPLAVYEPDFFERMRARGVFATMPEPPAGSL